MAMQGDGTGTHPELGRLIVAMLAMQLGASDERAFEVATETVDHLRDATDVAAEDVMQFVRERTNDGVFVAKSNAEYREHHGLDP